MNTFTHACRDACMNEPLTVGQISNPPGHTLHLLPSRRKLTFQGRHGLSHLPQEESPVFHVLQGDRSAGRRGVLLQVFHEVFQLAGEQADQRWQ